ncbi:MAG: MotA/TolQ/ExbB proton channel family protein [Nitrospira sp.]|nr:MotA/TolQ/ExbB proton channel family protein [Nitrospira sp.]
MPAEYKTEPRRFSDLTNVSVLGSFVLGLLLTVGTYLMVGSYLADFDYIPIYSYLYEQGLIPHICTVLFWTAISNMVLKTFKIRKESEAFKIFQEKFPEIANSTHSHIGMERIANWEKTLQSLSPKIRKLMLINRMEKAITRLKNSASSVEVDEMIQSLSDIDRALIDSSYTPIRFLNSIIPILGFLGTVYGIGVAISSFTNVLGTASSFEATKPALQIAASNLGLAFNTTLLALFYSGIILFIHSLIQKREEDLLSEIDDFCIGQFVSRMRIPPVWVSEIKESITKSGQDTVQAVKDFHVTYSDNEASFTELLGKILTILDANETKREAALGNNRKALVIEIRKIKDETLEEFKKVLNNGDLKNIKNVLDEWSQVLEEKIIPSLTASEVHLHGILQSLDNPSKELESLTVALGGLVKDFERVVNLEGPLKGLLALGDMPDKIQQTLETIEPAFQKISGDTAQAVDQVMKKLLKVLVWVHNLPYIINDSNRNEFNDDKRIDQLFLDTPS